MAGEAPFGSGCHAVCTFRLRRHGPIHKAQAILGLTTAVHAGGLAMGPHIDGGTAAAVLDRF